MRTRRRCSQPPVFTTKDYNSKNGFLTSVWGPSMWFTLHMISLNYPNQPTARQKGEYKQFFDSLQNVLPCGICRNNLGKNLRCTKYGPHVFENRDTLSRFVHRLHNCVNRMLGKKRCGVSYEKMRCTYENFRARCSMKKEKGGSTRQRGPRCRVKLPREGGCTDPITGVKSKCTLRIVPIDICTESIKIDQRCLSRRHRSSGATRRPRRPRRRRRK